MDDFFMGLSLHDTLLYFCACLLIGFVDTISGGGAVIALPVILLLSVPFIDAFFTEKVSVLVVFVFLIIYFTYKKFINPKEMAIPFLVSILGGFVGGRLVLLFDPKELEIIIPIAIVIVLIYFLIDPTKNVKTTQKPLLSKNLYHPVNFTIGAYDGFLGPASGSMYIASLVALRASSLQNASISTKVLNFGNLVGAIVALSFDSGEQAAAKLVPSLFIIQVVAMGVGAIIGAKLIIYNPQRIIRPLLIIVSLAALISFTYKRFM